jgi:hypothetical protein
MSHAEATKASMKTQPVSAEDVDTIRRWRMLMYVTGKTADLLGDVYQEEKLSLLMEEPTAALIRALADAISSSEPMLERFADARSVTSRALAGIPGEMLAQYLQTAKTCDENLREIVVFNLQTICSHLAADNWMYGYAESLLTKIEAPLPAGAPQFPLKYMRPQGSS